MTTASDGRSRTKKTIMKAITNNNNFYGKHLKTFASQNRKQMTRSEARLWKYVLRAKKTGFTFNRQRPVLNYIADFMCKPLKLIIEADGYTHLLEDVILNDRIRQTNLENAGFTVIRFKDEEVLKELELVEKKILDAINVLQKRNDSKAIHV